MMTTPLLPCGLRVVEVQARMAQRRFPWKVVVASAAVLLVVAGIGAYLVAMRGFVHAYYLAEYQLTPLTNAELGEPPARFRLTDVPWLSEPAPLCQSVSLRMLAAQQGRVEDRSTLDFLMGFTWGASPIPRRSGFFPGQDPEPGFLRAAPHLGFTRRYLTTDSAEDFVKGLKTFLSKGRAVRVALDRSMALDERGLTPHSVVLIGYDENGFEYYEPTCDDVKRCQPGEQPEGSAGLTLSTERLLLAEESQSLAFQYPWKYQLLVLDKGPIVPSLETAVQRNARALIGAKGQGPSSGSVAVGETAKAIEQHGQDVVTPELLRGVRLAAQVRREGAATLLALFPGRAALGQASDLLRDASSGYTAASHALEAKDLTEGAAALRKAAKADLEAGEAMLNVAH